MRTIPFKDYDQNQLPILPLDISEMIPEGHLARAVNEVVNHISFEVFQKAFENEGQPPYHPRMMMKVLIYSFSTKLYSSRKIEKALKQDIVYMWLSGMQYPDHNTISRFRSYYFQNIIEEVFTKVLEYLHKNGYIRFENHFVDGTKIEANAGKYTYVWKKNIQRYKSILRERVKEIFHQIDVINAQEDEQYGNNSLEELGAGKTIDSASLKQIANELNAELQGKPKETRKKLHSKIRDLKSKAEKLEEYEQKEQILGKRSSFSKTDPDATFMRMKGSEELRAGYNVQISTEDQFITNYSIHSNPSDAGTFTDHIEQIKNRGEEYIPNTYTGDAAYGSEENYHSLEELGIESYLKYNTFYQETTKPNDDPFQKQNMKYDSDHDCFICSKGKQIVFVSECFQTTDNGYKTRLRQYKCFECQGCEFKDKCKKSDTHRTIQVREKLDKYKAQARDNLSSEKGISLRKQRGCDVETVFGNIKHNMGYRRFYLRGKEKAYLEMGWISIAHNIQKLNNLIKKVA